MGAYLDELLADSPLWVAMCGESAGTTMLDASGNGRDGTIDAGVTLGAPGLIPSEGAATSWALDGYEGGTVDAAPWMAPASALVDTSGTAGAAAWPRTIAGTAATMPEARSSTMSFLMCLSI